MQEPLVVFRVSLYYRHEVLDLLLDRFLPKIEIYLKVDPFFLVEA